MAEVAGGIIRGLPGGMGPEVEGIAGAAALKAVEGVLLEVGREATAGARSGAVQGARATLLGALAASESRGEPPRA